MEFRVKDVLGLSCLSLWQIYNMLEMCNSVCRCFCDMNEWEMYLWCVYVRLQIAQPSPSQDHCMMYHACIPDCKQVILWINTNIFSVLRLALCSVLFSFCKYKMLKCNAWRKKNVIYHLVHSKQEDRDGDECLKNLGRHQTNLRPQSCICVSPGFSLMFTSIRQKERER